MLDHLRTSKRSGRVQLHPNPPDLAENSRIRLKNDRIFSTLTIQLHKIDVIAVTQGFHQGNGSNLGSGILIGLSPRLVIGRGAVRNVEDLVARRSDGAMMNLNSPTEAV